MSIDITPTHPAKSYMLRIFKCIFRQKSKTKRCPDLNGIEGKSVLVTGGSAGVGEFISRSLIKAGANVTSISRGLSQNTGSITGLKSIVCDLASPKSIVSVVNQFDGKQFDIVICNAGVTLNHYQKTELGIEKTFAVNVFGHHLLYRLLIEHNRLADNGKIIMTSGEIYVHANDCIPNPEPYKAMRAYAGSKLGNLWQVLELTKRYPQIKAIAVHPGVIASGFGMASKEGLLHWLKNRVMISEELGAQSSLIAATQHLPNGAYWHNVHGIIDLPDDDIAKNEVLSLKLWNQLETLAEPWI